MKQISRTKILKVLALGAVVTTPMLFMTSCSSSEPGTRYIPTISLGGVNVQEIKSSAAGVIQDVASFATSAQILNNNAIAPNSLYNGTPSTEAINFNALMTEPFVSGSGPFIEQDNVVGLVLSNVDLKATLDPDLKEANAKADGEKKLDITSVELSFKWYNKYLNKIYTNFPKSELQSWIDSGNVKSSSLKQAMTTEKTEYKVIVNIAASYTFEGKANKPWAIKKEAKWEFANSTGSELKGPFDSISKINDLRTKISNEASKTQSNKYASDKSFFEETKKKFGGIITIQ